MPASPKVAKGYVKTENMILAMLVCLAVGFVIGVVFSAYRSSPIPPGSANPPTASAPMTRQQQDKLNALIQATQATPDNVNAWTQLGHLYFDNGNHAKAIEAYEKSLALDDQRPDVWTDLGVMYRRSGNPDQAIASFDKALELNPHHDIAFFNKGVVLMHDKNDPAAALATWEQLLQFNPQAKTPNGQSLKIMVDELKKNLP